MIAIILAAGSGTRISKYTKNIPKSLVKVNGKSIIEYQILALREAGIQKIIVVTGHYSEKFTLNEVTFVKDENYMNHDILGSLMEARKYIQNELLILYSDIIFDSKIIQEILYSKDDIVIGVDLNWEKHYEGRTEHPKSEAENVLLNSSNKIIEIRKNIQKNNGVIGEFIGIIKLTSNGSKLFVKKFDEISKRHTSKFHEAPSLLKAYLTHMIQELIDSDIQLTPIFISGKWCEIDTIQDLRNAELKLKTSHVFS